MRSFLKLALGLAWVSLGLFPASAAERATVFVPVQAHDPGEAPAPVVWAVADEVLVRVRPQWAALAGAQQDVLGGQLRWIVPRNGAALQGAREASVFGSLAVVKLPPGSSLEEALDALNRHPGILHAEPNLRLELAAGSDRVPSDYEFGRQWALHNTGQSGGVAGADIGALEAWKISTGSAAIHVAIIDTGVDYFHPDLESNIWSNPGEVPGNGIDDDGNGYIDDLHGYDFVSDDGDPMDDNVHGTHVAGILGAVGDDENGITGVAWSVRMMALKAFDEAGSGTLDDTIAAIHYAVSAGARVINASWGTTTRSRALDEVVAEAVRGGVVFVAAAGNNGSDVGFYPASVPEALAVGATDARDGSAIFSNFGAFVDLVAPGDAIHSTVPNASWSILSGTSMAAPHVSGVIALMLAIRPEFTPPQVAAILQSTARELETDRFTGAGRVNAARAVAISEPLPDAALDVPAEVSGRVDFKGTAAGHRFAGFRLELGNGKRPATWEEVAAGSQPVADGILLADFDTTTLDDGEYTLRLAVTNALGEAALVRTAMVIRNVQVLSPRNNDILRSGGAVEIRGTVGGAGQTFEVAWGLGRHPAEWRTDGVTLAEDGRSPVVEGLLARWESTTVSSNEFVTFRLTARRENRMVGEAFVRSVHMEGRLSPGWPVALPFTEEFPVANWREFVTADLDGDGSQEILLVDHGEPGGRPPRLLAFDPAGALRWARDLPKGAPEHDSPVIGDLDGDGRLEILVDTGDAGWISAFDAEGKPLERGWPVAPGGTHFGKVLADLDGDGRLELVAVSSPPPDLVSGNPRSLVVVSADGVVLRRWTLTGCHREAAVPEQLPAVGNLDGDDGLEIVAVDGCSNVSAFDLESDEPLWTAVTQAHLVASPVVGDLDGDGREEVVIGGVKTSKGSPGGLYQWDREGQLRGGWPILQETSFHASAALADLENDGWLEIVIPSWDAGTIHAVRADGFELRGWPVPSQVNAATRSVPVVGDIDGDGWPDVIVPSPGYWLHVVLTGDTVRSGGIRAWRFDGSLIDLQPLAPPDSLVMESASGLDWHRYPPCVLTDLDGDGWLDVLGSSIQDRAYSPTAPLATSKMRSSLYRWELPVPVRAESLPWPMFHGGASRTGRYYRPPPPNQPPVLRNVPNQTVAVGEAYRPIDLDRYVEDPDDPRETLTWTVIQPDPSALLIEIDARHVLWVDPLRPDWAGREEIRLSVRDPSGAEVSTRLVFAAIPGYRPPVAVVDQVTTVEEVPVELNPVANDTSPDGRALRIAGVSGPGWGATEVLPDGTVRYTPLPDFFGEDSFEYTMTDDEGGLATGEVRVTVVGVNDPPAPGPDRLILEEDTTLDFEPLANDLDVDGDALFLVSIDPPAHGILESLGEARFRFQPSTNYFGVETFTYLVRDPGGLVATGEVAILVKAVNDIPVLADQTLTLNRNRATDIFYAAEDADGDVLGFTIVDGPVNGVLLSYPTLANFQPHKGFVGVDHFTYTTTDGFATVGPARVTLIVQDVNNAPEVEPVSIVTAVEQPITIGLRVRDADDDPVTLRVSEPPRNGTVTVQGTNAFYQPAAGFIGTESFYVRASDGALESPSTLISVRVTDENTPPRAESEVLTVGRNRSTPVRLRASDGENNPLRFEIVSPPLYGRLEGDPPEVLYTPPPNFRGVDRLEFTAADLYLTSQVAVVHLLVRDPNVIPVVTNQVLRIAKDRPAQIRLQVVDADGHALRTAILKGPSRGKLFGTGLDFTYVPPSGFEGQVTFTYKVWDGFAYSAQGVVTLQVERADVTPVRITGVRWVEGGVELAIQSAPGDSVRIEASDDLRTWTPRGTISNPTGSGRWIDPESAETAARFYRLAVERGLDVP